MVMDQLDSVLQLKLEGIGVCPGEDKVVVCMSQMFMVSNRTFQTSVFKGH